MSDTNRSRRGLFALGGGLLVAGAIAVPVAMASGGFGGHCRGPRGPVTVERIQDHGAFFAGHMVDALDGTDAQEAEIEAIVDRYAPGFVALHEDAEALHEDMAEVLLAEQVDRSALEPVRLEGLELADEASSTAMDFVAEIAGVLSQEQRLAAKELIDERHGR